MEGTATQFFLSHIWDFYLAAADARRSHSMCLCHACALHTLLQLLAAGSAFRHAQEVKVIRGYSDKAAVASCYRATVNLGVRHGARRSPREMRF